MGCVKHHWEVEKDEIRKGSTELDHIKITVESLSHGDGTKGRLEETNWKVRKGSSLKFFYGVESNKWNNHWKGKWGQGWMFFKESYILMWIIYYRKKHKNARERAIITSPNTDEDNKPLRC